MTPDRGFVETGLALACASLDRPFVEGRRDSGRQTGVAAYGRTTHARDGSRFGDGVLALTDDEAAVHQRPPPSIVSGRMDACSALRSVRRSGGDCSRS
jgi:hypothetical protein